MRKIIIGIVLISMVSWAVYEFIAPKEDTSNSKSSDEEMAETEDDISENLENNTVVEEEEQTFIPFPQATEGLDFGNTAPDFILQSLDGEEVRLSDFRGQRVLLNFWATWCGPCRIEMPDMEKFYQSKDVTVLAVNLTETEASIQQIQDFVDEYDLTFPILLDDTITVATLYAIQPIPTSFLIDSKGIIQNKAFGALTYDLMVDEFEKMQ